MCLFPLSNTDYNGAAYKHGVTEFDCGSCPECLRKRSNVWALRAVYEAKLHAFNCMVTLTYDTFAYDSNGKIIGENPVNPDLKVNKRHVQLFVKRLRKWYSTITNEKIKVLICAEYGSRTHRAHYHLILFGVRFPDIHYYKKSKRGNVIYMSNILTRLWSHGICTVDSINVHSAIARYCTKYCAKTRSDETFMLCSKHIGMDSLYKDFNGINYMIDGKEYPIPRFIWERFITEKYSQLPFNFSPKYVNRTDKSMSDGSFGRSVIQREIYRMIRDTDSIYLRYLDYWQKRSESFDQIKQPILNRIYALDDSKYHAYKCKALQVYSDKRFYLKFFFAPGSNCGKARYINDRVDIGIPYIHLPFSSRPYTANDTNESIFIGFSNENYNFFRIFHIIS